MEVVDSPDDERTPHSSEKPKKPAPEPSNNHHASTQNPKRRPTQMIVIKSKFIQNLFPIFIDYCMQIMLLEVFLVNFIGT